MFRAFSLLFLSLNALAQGPGDSSAVSDRHSSGSDRAVALTSYSSEKLKSSACFPPLKRDARYYSSSIDQFLKELDEAFAFESHQMRNDFIEANTFTVDLNKISDRRPGIIKLFEPFEDRLARMTNQQLADWSLLLSHWGDTVVTPKAKDAEKEAISHINEIYSRRKSQGQRDVYINNGDFPPSTHGSQSEKWQYDWTDLINDPDKVARAAYILFDGTTAPVESVGTKAWAEWLGHEDRKKFDVNSLSLTQIALLKEFLLNALDYDSRKAFEEVRGKIKSDDTLLGLKIDPYKEPNHDELVQTLKMERDISCRDPEKSKTFQQRKDYFVEEMLGHGVPSSHGVPLNLRSQINPDGTLKSVDPKVAQTKGHSDADAKKRAEEPLSPEESKAALEKYLNGTTNTGFCFPPTSRDVRYYNDPVMTPLLSLLDQSYAEKLQGDLRQSFLLKLRKSKPNEPQSFDLAALTPEGIKAMSTASLVDWSLMFAIYGDEGGSSALYSINKRLSEKVKEGKDPFAKAIGLLPVKVNPTTKQPEIDWETVIDRPSLRTKIQREAFAGSSLPISRFKSLDRWREWVKNGNLAENDLGSLSLLQMSLLKETLMGLYDADSRKKVQEEHKLQFDGDPPLKFKFDLLSELSPAERLKAIRSERKRACSDPKAAELARARNDIIAGVLGRRGPPLSPHGLPLEMRARFEKKLQDLNKTDASLEKSVSERVRAVSQELASAKNADELKIIDSMAFGAKFLTSFFYQAAGDDPVHFWEQQALLAKKEDRKPSQKQHADEKESREREVQWVNGSLRLNGRMLSPAEMDDLRSMSDSDLKILEKAVEVVGRPPSKSVVKRIVDVLRGGEIDENNILHAIELPTLTQSIRVNTDRLPSYQLFPEKTGDDNFDQWSKEQNKAILEKTAKQFEENSRTGARGDWFRFFDEAYKKAYGTSLSKRFCGEEACVGQAALKPLSDQERITIHKFIHMEKLAFENPSIHRTSRASESPLNDQMAFEERLLDEQLKKFAQQVKDCEGQVNPACSIDKVRQQQWLWLREMSAALEMEAKSYEQDPQFKKQAKTAKHMLEKMDRFRFPEAVTADKARAGLGDLVDIVYTRPDGKKTTITSVPDRLLSSPTSFREELLDRMEDELIDQVFPNPEDAKRVKTDGTADDDFKISHWIMFNSRNVAVGNSNASDQLKSLISRAEQKTDEEQYFRYLAGYYRWVLKSPRLQYDKLELGRPRESFHPPILAWLRDQKGTDELLKEGTDKVYGLGTDQKAKVEVRYRPDPTIQKESDKEKKEERKQAFSETYRLASKFQNQPFEATRAQIQAMRKGTPHQQQQVKNLAVYFDKLPGSNPIRKELFEGDMPAQFARYASDPEVIDLWAMTSPEYRLRQHRISSDGSQSHLSKEEVLNSLRSEVKIEVPRGAPPSKKTEQEDKKADFTDAIADVLDKKLNGNPLAANSVQIDFSNIEEQFTKPELLVKAVENARAYYLLNLLKVSKKIEGKELAGMGSLPPKLHKMLVADPEKSPETQAEVPAKLVKLKGLLASTIYTLDNYLLGRQPSAIDGSWLDPYDLTKRDKTDRELKLLDRKIEHATSEERKEIDGAFVKAKRNPLEDEVGPPPDISLSWIQECEKFLATYVEDEKKVTSKDATRGFEYLGLPQRSRVMLLELPGFLQDAMKEFCSYNRGDGTRGLPLFIENESDALNLDREIAQLIYNPIPGRILSLIASNREAREIYARHVEWGPIDRALLELGNGSRRGFDGNNPEFKAEYERLRQMRGPNNTPKAWTEAGVKGGLKTFIQQLPTLSDATKQKVKQWALNELIALHPWAKELSQKSPEDLLKDFESQEKFPDMIDFNDRELRGPGRLSSQLLVMLVSLIDEAGDKEKGEIATRLENKKGGLARFDPSIMAAMALQQNRIMPEKVEPKSPEILRREVRQDLEDKLGEARRVADHPEVRQRNAPNTKDGQIFLDVLLGRRDYGDIHLDADDVINRLDSMTAADRKNTRDKLTKLIDIYTLPPGMKKESIPPDIYRRIAGDSYPNRPEADRKFLSLASNLVKAIDDKNTADTKPFVDRFVSSVKSLYHRISGTEPEPPKDTRIEKERRDLISRVEAHLAKGGTHSGPKRLTLARKIELERLPTDALKSLVSMGDHAQQREQQGYDDVRELWVNLAQTGNPDDFENSRNILDRHDAELARIKRLDQAGIRNELIREIRDTGKIDSPEGKERLHSLAQNKFDTQWLPNVARDRLSSRILTDADKKETVENLAANGPKQIAILEEDIERELGQSLTQQELGLLQKQLRRKAAALLKVPENDPSVSDLAAHEFETVIQHLGTEPGDWASLPKEVKEILEANAKPLFQISRSMGLDLLDSQRRDILAYADELDREAKPYREAAANNEDPKEKEENNVKAGGLEEHAQFLRNDFLKAWSSDFVKELKGDGTGKSVSTPHSAARAAWKNALERAEKDPVYKSRVRDVVRAKTKIMDHGSAETHIKDEIRGARAVMSADLCGDGGKMLSDFSNKAWLKWKEGEKTRAESKLPPGLIEKWQKFQEKKLQAEELIEFEKAVKGDQLKESEAKIDAMVHDITQRYQMMENTDRNSDWFDQKIWNVERRGRVTHNLEVVQSDLKVELENRRHLEQEAGKIDEREDKLVEDLGKEENSLLGEVGDAVESQTISGMPDVDFIVDFINTSGQQLPFLSTGDRASDQAARERVQRAISKYFDWRGRVDQLGKAAASLQIDPLLDSQFKALSQEGENCALGFRVDPGESEEAVKTANSSESSVMEKRKKVLQALSKYGVTVTGNSVDTGHLHLPYDLSLVMLLVNTMMIPGEKNKGEDASKSPGEGQWASSEDLESKLDELGDYIPSINSSPLLASAGISSGLRPGQALRRDFMTRWKLQGRPAVFEYVDPKLDIPGVPVSGLAVRPIEKDGRVTFLIADLQEQRNRASALVKDMREKQNEMVNKVNELKDKNDHMLVPKDIPFLGWWDFFGADVVQNALAGERQGLLSDIAELKKLGNVAASLSNKGNSLESRLVARQMELDVKHHNDRDIVDTLHGIATDAEWRRLNYALSISLYGASKTVTAGALARMLQSARTINQLEMLGAFIEKDMRPGQRFFGTEAKSPGNYSDTGKSIVLGTSLFFVSPLAGDSLTAINRRIPAIRKVLTADKILEADRVFEGGRGAIGATKVVTESEAMAAANSWKAFVARQVASPTWHHIAGTGAVSGLMSVSEEVSNALLNDYRLIERDKDGNLAFKDVNKIVWNAFVKSLGDSFGMSMVDQKAAGVFADGLTAGAVSFVTNTLITWERTKMMVDMQRSEVTQKLKEEVDRGKLADPAKIRGYEEQLKKLDSTAVAWEAEINSLVPHLIFANLARKHSQIPRLGAELLGTGKRGSSNQEAGNFDRVFARAKVMSDRENAEAKTSVTTKLDKAVDKLFGGSPQSHDHTPHTVLAQALMEAPAYKIEAVRQQAELGNPEALKVLEQLGRLESPDPENPIYSGKDVLDMLTDARASKDYDPLDSFRAQAPLRRRMIAQQAKRRLDDYIEKNPEAKAQQLAPFYDQMVRHDPKIFREVPIERLVDEAKAHNGDLPMEYSKLDAGGRGIWGRRQTSGAGFAASYEILSTKRRNSDLGWFD